MPINTMRDTIELKPIKETTSDYEKIEARIKKIFRELIYEPLLKELKISKKKVLNAEDSPLVKALKSGEITYSRGSFRGKFNAGISKELRALGAKWDRKTSAFKLAQDDMGYELISTIRSSEIYFQSKLLSIDSLLAKILPENISEQLKITDLFDSALWKVETDFQKQLKNITIAPQLSPYRINKIAEEWQNNMDIWIRGFTEKQITELRTLIKETHYAGNRWETLVEGIQKSYGVTSRKAKFLARQETSLLMTKFKEARYTEVGIHEYKWGCVKMPHDKSPDPKKHVPGNVRYFHGILEGTIQRWDRPPKTSENPLKYNNAGEDYNCRCFAIPVLRKKK